MRKLYYMGLESYVGRYTYQLEEWNRRVFDKRGLDVVYVQGKNLRSDQAIVTGQVLDAHGRSYYSMSQLMSLIEMMQAGEVTSEDVVYFEDMFQPGFESLPYIIDQVAPCHRPKIYVRCLAQSIDPDDFVHCTGMSTWMGHYEKMVDSVVDGMLASNEEMVCNMKIAGWTAPVYNISGLAFGKAEVQERVPVIKPFADRPKRVAFAARIDSEKQPDFYLDLIASCAQDSRFTGVEFCIMAGGKLRSNDDVSLNRIKLFATLDQLKIYENLSKNEYYELLNNSRVMFNCALQDWTSNTVSEADALGTNVLFPAYRSFPEIFANDETRMYIPWSLNDAKEKLFTLLQTPSENIGKISDYTDKTIDRICDILEGQSGYYQRSSVNYRRYVSEKKYG